MLFAVYLDDSKFLCFLSQHQNYRSASIVATYLNVHSIASFILVVEFSLSIRPYVTVSKMCSMVYTQGHRTGSKIYLCASGDKIQSSSDRFSKWHDLY